MYAAKIYNDSRVNSQLAIPFAFAALRLVVTDFRPLLVLFGPLGLIGTVFFVAALAVFFVSLFAVSINRSDHVHVLKLQWEHGRNMSKIQL